MSDQIDPATPRDIRHETFSTDEIEKARRVATWLSRGWPSVATLFDVTVLGEFETSADTYILDHLIVQYSVGSARRYDRSRTKLRSDGIDVLGVNVTMVEGMTATALGETRAVPPGAILLADAAQPLRTSMPGGPSIQLVIPRDIATTELGSVADLHGTQIPPENAAILVAHLDQLHKVIAGYGPQQGARLVRTILDMLWIALENGRENRPRSTAVARSIGEQARQLIDTNLGREALGPEWIATQLGIARSTLYRGFGTPGIEAYIRKARLRRIAAALRDPENVERLDALADRWQFSDASHLSRQFRAEFGQTPSAYRRDAASGKIS